MAISSPIVVFEAIRTWYNQFEPYDDKASGQGMKYAKNGPSLMHKQTLIDVTTRISAVLLWSSANAGEIPGRECCIRKQRERARKSSLGKEGPDKQNKFIYHWPFWLQAGGQGSAFYGFLSTEVERYPCKKGDNLKHILNLK